MSDSPLPGLLDQAARLLNLVGELADGIRANELSPSDESRRRVASAWSALLPAIVEVGESLPSEPHPVVDWIREVGRVSEWFDGAIQQHGLAEVLFSFDCDGFARVDEEGRALFAAMAPKRGRFAFVDMPTAKEAVPTNPVVQPPDAAEPAEASDKPPTKPKRSTEKGEAQAAIRLLSVYTHGLADERLNKANDVLNDDKLSTDEKLWKIDALMPIPPTTSAANLGEALGVSKTAVQKTAWYMRNRKGRKENEIGHRREQHRRRGQQYEGDRQHDD